MDERQTDLQRWAPPCGGDRVEQAAALDQIRGQVQIGYGDFPAVGHAEDHQEQTRLVGRGVPVRPVDPQIRLLLQPSFRVLRHDLSQRTRSAKSLSHPANDCPHRLDGVGEAAIGIAMKRDSRSAHSRRPTR